MFVLPIPEPDGNDIALQLFTSGSTGTPKAICHTHAGMIAYMYDYMEGIQVGAGGYLSDQCKPVFICRDFLFLMSLMVGSTTVFFCPFCSDGSF